MPPELTTTLNLACQALYEGKIIAYPTEAVFGLGCDPFNFQALQQLFQLKQRPVNKPMILLAPDLESVWNYTQPLPEECQQRVIDSWPGAVTWIFPANDKLPVWLKNADNTVAIRVTAHPSTAQLLTFWGKLLVSTSANISTFPPARTKQQVENYFPDALAYIVDQSIGNALNPTEIRDARSGKIIRSS